jgi:4-alpha-glucanotransferase
MLGKQHLIRHCHKSSTSAAAVAYLHHLDGGPALNLQRCSGILLHPSSLPGPYSIGTLGRECRDFIDFLVASGQSVWQILPLGPTGYGDSPYSSFSAFAGNPLLICLEQLVDEGDLNPADLVPFQGNYPTVDYSAADNMHSQLLGQAWQNFCQRASSSRRQVFSEFCQAQSSWLDDYAIFRALRSHFGERPWHDWPEEILQRQALALSFWGEQLNAAVMRQKYIQFVFFQQWFSIKQYANLRGIKILGDLPIFVAHDSSDVWANQPLFQLGPDGSPHVVAGVPPDYFSATGQRWGNPLYNWDRLLKDDFSWWKTRLRWNLQLTDLLRIDHFRGFSACWEIPAEDQTAINGRWVATPGHQLFATLKNDLGDLPLIAEDLGVITAEVEQLREYCHLPGMKILQFAFDSGPDNPYLPHNIEKRSVVYTGTHDNNTTLGWWVALDNAQKNQVRDYLGHACHNMPWDLIRTALQCRSDLCVIPLQDILALPASARMNRPGQACSNWVWRFPASALSLDLAEQLQDLGCHYGRTQPISK